LEVGRKLARGCGREICVPPEGEEGAVKEGESWGYWVREEKLGVLDEARVEAAIVLGPGGRPLTAACKKERLNMPFEAGEEVVEKADGGERGGGGRPRGARRITMNPEFVQEKA
jgi:hypothetical protein